MLIHHMSKIWISLTQTFEKPVDPPVFILMDGFQVLLHSQLKKPWGDTDDYIGIKHQHKQRQTMHHYFFPSCKREDLNGERGTAVLHWWHQLPERKTLSFGEFFAENVSDFSASVGGWSVILQLSRHPSLFTVCAVEHWFKWFTSHSLPAVFSLLDEAAKHLSLHEDLQEAAHRLGRDRLTEAVTLEGAGDRWGRRGRIAVFSFPDKEELIVANQLHEEANKGLRHHRAQMTGIWGAECNYCNNCHNATSGFSEASPVDASPPLSLARSLLLSRMFSKADWSFGGKPESSSSS